MPIPAVTLPNGKKLIEFVGEVQRLHERFAHFQSTVSFNSALEELVMMWFDPYMIQQVEGEQSE